jgi:HSP20 family molecular chaperone IbpA
MAASNWLGFWIPMVDMKEGEKWMTICAELPGVNRNEIRMDGVLTISGEKRDTNNGKRAIT